MFRFLLLFSYLIPISLRVNLDMGKIFYSWSIQKDKDIPGTVARSTTIPEELGRVSYLLTDKTGTLTQNQMVFKKLHLGSVAYCHETFDEITHHLSTHYANHKGDSKYTPKVHFDKKTLLFWFCILLVLATIKVCFEKWWKDSDYRIPISHSLMKWSRYFFYPDQIIGQWCINFFKMYLYSFCSQREPKFARPLSQK